MERVATGVAKSIAGLFTVSAGRFLGCKGKFVFATTVVHKFTFLFVEGNGEKGVCIYLVAAVVFCFNF